MTKLTANGRQATRINFEDSTADGRGFTQIGAAKGHEMTGMFSVPQLLGSESRTPKEYSRPWPSHRRYAGAPIRRFAVSGRRDSNPRPLEPHSSALPSCATA